MKTRGLRSGKRIPISRYHPSHLDSKRGDPVVDGNQDERPIRDLPLSRRIMQETSRVEASYPPPIHALVDGTHSRPPHPNPQQSESVSSRTPPTASCRSPTSSTRIAEVFNYTVMEKCIRNSIRVKRMLHRAQSRRNSAHEPQKYNKNLTGLSRPPPLQEIRPPPSPLSRDTSYEDILSPIGGANLLSLPSSAEVIRATRSRRGLLLPDFEEEEEDKAAVRLAPIGVL